MTKASAARVARRTNGHGGGVEAHRGVPLTLGELELRLHYDWRSALHLERIRGISKLRAQFEFINPILQPPDGDLVFGDLLDLLWTFAIAHHSELKREELAANLDLHNVGDALLALGQATLRCFPQAVRVEPGTTQEAGSDTADPLSTRPTAPSPSPSSSLESASTTPGG